MIFGLPFQFDVYFTVGLALCLDSILYVKALIGTFNQEKALVGAFSVIVQLH